MPKAIGQFLSGLPPLRGLFPLVLFLAAWQAIDPQGSPYFPPPSAWWASIVTLTKSGRLMPALNSTLLTLSSPSRSLAFFGGSIGVLIGRSPLARRLLGPLLNSGRGWHAAGRCAGGRLVLGYVESLKLVIVVLVAVWPILLNTASSTSALFRILGDVSRTLRIGRLATLRKIVLPAAAPRSWSECAVRCRSPS